MFIYIARLLVIIAGPLVGYFQISPDGKGILIGTGVALLVIAAEIIIQSVRLDDLVAGFIGLFLGLISASFLRATIPALFDSVSVTRFFENYNLMLSIVLGYIGMLIALKKKDELDLLDRDIKLTGKKLAGESIKIIDSSVIIDGRILDLVQTGFLEGALVIPTIVLNELQALADSPEDDLRKRARRALDIAVELRESAEVSCKIYEKDYPEMAETDQKLIRMSKDLKAKLVTSDFNLNKVARAQGIVVLNINELANAVKARLLPGEKFEVFIMKKGKEESQGIGFLEDGTMVIIEDGQKHIGTRVEAKVSSLLQKPSGRMIFARVD
ncbi:MAG: TRAM domain-containing protein [Elusimicrobia bacterium]|nr:TRAM domain-containing protein [Elusimicrobiota bacterium]